MERAMTRREILRYGAAALAGGVVGAGCARDTARKDGRTTIRYMAWGNPEQLQVERQIADEFEKQNPKLRIHLFMVPGSAYGDKLQLMLASRTAPDVMRVDHYMFPALVRKDYFLSLDPFIAAEPKGFLDDFARPAVEECEYKGSMYALNVLFGGVQIYYNKNLFKEAGLPDPYQEFQAGRWTWEKFVETAIALTKRENGRVTQFGTTHPTFPLYTNVIWNHGGDVMDPEMTRLTLYSDENARRGIEEYANLRWKHKCAPTPADNALSPFTFESGRIAMNWGWSGESPRFRKNIKKFEWDICPTPTGPKDNKTVVKGNQLVINKHSRHSEEAWQFVKFMTSRTAELKLGGELRRSVPTRLSVQTAPEYLKSDLPPFQTDVFLDAVKRGKTLPINWRYQEWVQEYNAALDGLFNVGSDTAEYACREAERRVNALLASEEGF
jgi:multiple sugar transport system substrate-binding protein